MSTEQAPASAPEGGIPGTDPQQTATAPADEAQQSRPRTGPIVWGAIVLAVCVYVATQTLSPGSIDSTTFVIASVIGLGVLLLAVGAAVLARNSRQR